MVPEATQPSSPSHCPSPPPLPPERREQLVTQSMAPVMVLTNGKTDVFQKPKGEDPEAVSEDRILFLSKD